MSKRQRKEKKLVAEEVGILAANQDEVVINHFYHYDTTQTEIDEHEGGDVETAKPKKKRQTKAQKKAAAQQEQTSTDLEAQTNQKIYEELAALSALSPSAQACVQNILGNPNLLAEMSNQVAAATNEKKKKVTKKAQKKAQAIESPIEVQQDDAQEIGESSTADQTMQSVKNTNTQISQAPFDPNNQLSTIQNFKNMLGSWKQPLAEITNQNYFSCMFDYMKEQYAEGNVLPHKDLIFNAFKQSEFKDTKVVILGNEPYCQPGYANGLCFSVQPNVVRVPQTLMQIYKAMDNDEDLCFAMPEPMHGDLTHWANQGVLLLNELLTVRTELRKKKETTKKGQKFVSGTHKKKGWENFTRDVISAINEKCENVVYLCFGVKAQAMIEPLVDQSKNLIIKERHPSLQVVTQGPRFDQSKCFSECNKYLEKNGKCAIDWNL